MANYFREVGHPILDFRHCHFALQSISSQNDLDLLSAEKEKSWHLSFSSLF